MCIYMCIYIYIEREGNTLYIHIIMYDLLVEFTYRGNRYRSNACTSRIQAKLHRVMCYFKWSHFSLYQSGGTTCLTPCV